MKIFSFPTLNAIETIKDLKQTKTFGDFQVFDSRCRPKSKTLNLGNFIFLVIIIFNVLFPIVLLSLVSASKVYHKKCEKNAKKHRKL